MEHDEEKLATAFRILVVDREDVAQNVQRLLREDDVVISAPNALVASHRIIEADADGAPFDVVLCRIDIDDTRGRGILRATQTCAETPIFIYLARYCDERIDSLQPADGILIKPFTGEELERLIEKIVMNRSRERTRRLLSDSYN